MNKYIEDDLTEINTIASDTDTKYSEEQSSLGINENKK